MRVLVTGDILNETTIHEFHEHDVAVEKRKGLLNEGELVKAVRDVDGYILGGGELVTERVVEGAAHLKAIVVWGADADAFFTADALRLMQERGITLETTGISTACTGGYEGQSEAAFELMIQVLSEQSSTA